MQSKTVSYAAAARDLFAPLRIALVALAALALAMSFQVNRAHAGGKWIGPAIAGAIIGGAIVHGLHNHHYKYHKRYAVRHHRPHGYVKHYRPRVVVAHPPVVYYHPVPVYRVYKPVRVYRHHPRVSFGIHVGW